MVLLAAFRHSIRPGRARLYVVVGDYHLGERLIPAENDVAAVLAFDLESGFN